MNRQNICQNIYFLNIGHTGQSGMQIRGKPWKSVVSVQLLQGVVLRHRHAHQEQRTQQPIHVTEALQPERSHITDTLLPCLLDDLSALRPSIDNPVWIVARLNIMVELKSGSGWTD